MGWKKLEKMQTTAQQQKAKLCIIVACIVLLIRGCKIRLPKPCRNFSSTTTTMPSCCCDSEGIYLLCCPLEQGEEGLHLLRWVDEAARANLT
ncbi:hypothetical protein QYE76_013448 [Lolium multiflorum]|uniref:Uncharacterized protein n=1 Tax=Lolium multiflorum TaxID=4521 RepID=A0AAD8X4V2_LOLMU|nr:hypothetical protein QYE76_013448 [Lolium multiflorum]